MAIFQIFSAFFCIFLVFSSILSVTSVKIRVKSCDSDDESNSVVESVYIEPCDHDPCHLKQGTTYKMLLNFTSRVKSTTLTSHVCGKIAGICIPFPLPKPDACQQENNFSFSENIVQVAERTDIITDLDADLDFKKDQTSNITCPIQENVNYSFETSLPIKSEYPRLSVTGKWSLIGDDDIEVVCFYMKIKIVSPDGNSYSVFNDIDMNEGKYDIL